MELSPSVESDNLVTVQTELITPNENIKSELFNNTFSSVATIISFERGNSGSYWCTAVAMSSTNYLKSSMKITSNVLNLTTGMHNAIAQLSLMLS